MNRVEAANKAIDRAGGVSALARTLLKKDGNLTYMIWRVAKWRNLGIPPLWVLRVEAISGISKHKLYPELYP